MMHSLNHLARAEELRQLQRYDLALQEVQRALAQDPHASAPHVCAAWIMRDQKRLPEAEQAARAALAAEPTDADAQHILAVTLWEQGRRDQARQAFEAALELVGGRSALYLTNYARMMTTYRRYSEALVALNLADRALALAPAFADPHEIRGLALRQLGRDVEAEAAFRTALRLNPQSFSAQHNLGLHDLTLGRAHTALDRFREALRLNPNSEIARTNLVLALKARNPLYGRALSLMLRGERPAGRRRGRWIALGFASAFVLTLPLSLVSPELSGALGMLWGWGALALLFVGVGRLVWFMAVDPIFNTLLLLDPLGRKALQFDPADGAVTGGIVALLVGLAGVAVTFPLLGESHPLSEGALILCFGAVVATVLAAAIRTTAGSGRRLSWIGYTLVLPALLIVIVIRLIYAADAESPIAAVMFGVAGLLFALGMLLFLAGRIIANMQRRSRRRAAQPQRRQGA
jgi:tetratricopeptide (TPR) repeat protein